MKKIAILLSLIMIAALILPVAVIADDEEPSNGQIVEASTAEQSSEESSADEASVEESSAEEASTEEPSTEESSAEEASTEESSAEESEPIPESCTVTYKSGSNYSIELQTESDIYLVSRKDGVFVYSVAYDAKVNVTVKDIAEHFQVTDIKLNNESLGNENLSFDFVITSDTSIEVNVKEDTKIVMEVQCDCEDGLNPELFKLYSDGKEISNSIGIYSGESATITVSADEGVVYAVKSALVLYDDATTVYADVKDRSTIILPVADSHYTVYITLAVSAYTVNVMQSEGGTITVSNLAPANEEIIDFTFTPDEGYELKSIIVNTEQFTIPSNVYSVKADSDLTVSAVFALKEQEFTVTKIIEIPEGQNANGTVVFPEYPDATDRVIAKQGTTVMVNIKANEGYVIEYIKLNGENYFFDNSGEYTVPVFMGKDNELRVKFKIKTYRITVKVTQEGGGEISAEGYTIADDKIYVEHGKNVVFVMTPHMNYVVYSVRADSKLTYSYDKADPDNPFDNTFTFENVTANHTFVVKFTRQGDVVTKHKITAAAGEGGSITPIGAQEVSQGESLTFEVTPNEGWEIDYITVDGMDAPLSDGEYTFDNVSADHTINAYFRQKAVDDPDLIEDGDIDWTKAVITIDMTAATKLSGAVLTKLGMNFSGRTVLIKLPNCDITFKASADISTSDEFVSIINFFGEASNDYSAISSIVGSRPQYSNSNFAVVTLASIFPEGSTANVYLGSDFVSKSVSCYYFDKTDLVRVSDTLVCGADGRVNNVPVKPGTLVFFSEKDKAITYNVTFKSGENGTITPSGTQTVEEGTVVSFRVKPNEGYIINKVYVNGEDIKKANVNEYSVAVKADTEIDVRFTLANQQQSSKAGLIISVAIIAVALIGGGVLFAVKWRQSKY